jgi:predicted dehydrogenase
MRSFADSLIHDKEPAVTGQDGVKALKIVLATYESHKKKTAVSLPDLL